MLGHLLVGRQQRTGALDVDAILFFRAVDQRVGFGKQKIGVQRENAVGNSRSRREFDKHNVLSAEARGNPERRAESLESPLDELGRVPRFGRLLLIYSFLLERIHLLRFSFLIFSRTKSYRIISFTPRITAITATVRSNQPR